MVHLWWVAGVTAGALGGTLIPDSVVGLDFAVTALFVVLALAAIRATPELPAPIAAVACAVLGHLLAGDTMLVVGMGLFLGYLMIRYVFDRRRHRDA